MIGTACAVPGCGSAPGEIFDTASTAHQWPPAPDQPRVRYIGQLASDEDLKAGVGFFEQVARAIAGKEPARGMVSPLGVCTDGGDRVFVADSGAGCVVMFDLSARTMEQWRAPAGERALGQVVAVAYDGAWDGGRGRVLAADSLEGRIVGFDRDGKWLGALRTGDLRRPCGLAVDPRGGRVLVVDSAAHQVVVLAMDGRELKRIGERGSGLGQFNFPTGVALSASGLMLVSDSLNFRVQVFDPDLRPIRQIGRKGDMPGYFAQPKGVGVDSEGHVYVVDANFEAVQLFSVDGELLMTFGREGQGPGEFWLPAGIHVSERGVMRRIWIADSYNKRVQVFDYLREEPRR